MKARTVFAFLLSLILILCASSAQAGTKHKKHRRHKIVVPDSPQPPELKPDHQDRIKQNEIADKLGIPIIWDDNILKQLKLSPNKRKDLQLAKVPYQLVTPLRLPYISIKSNAYTVPWVNDFLRANFGQEEYLIAQFKPELNSFSRTVQRQRAMTTPFRYVRRRHGKFKRVRNRAYNRNAAGFDDDHPELISLHCRMGIAMDFSRKRMKSKHIEHMRAKMIALKNKNIGVFPIEERTRDGKRINCWHVVVFDPVAYRELIQKTKIVPQTIALSQKSDIIPSVNGKTAP